MSEVPGCPRIGVVGVPDGWSTRRLAAAVEARTGCCHLVDLGEVSFDLAEGTVLAGGVDLGTLDAVIVKKLGPSYRRELLDRLEILHFLEQRRGVRVFSRPAAIMRLLDRLSCTVTLRIGGIPMPETVITEDLALATEAVTRFGTAVLKPLFTSKARGMELVETGPDAGARIEAFRQAGNSVLYIQRMVPIPGSDLGVVFLGGEYLACYARETGGSSWNTAVRSGGRYRSHEPSPEIIELARRAQGLFGLDFTCVDVVESPTGPLVFEVSAFGGFRGLKESGGLDAADHYAGYVLRKLGHDG